jgi:hypothetical protein
MTRDYFSSGSPRKALGRSAASNDDGAEKGSVFRRVQEPKPSKTRESNCSGRRPSLRVLGIPEIIQISKVVETAQLMNKELAVGAR